MAQILFLLASNNRSLFMSVFMAMSPLGTILQERPHFSTCVLFLNRNSLFLVFRGSLKKKRDCILAWRGKEDAVPMLASYAKL